MENTEFPRNTDKENIQSNVKMECVRLVGKIKQQKKQHIMFYPIIQIYVYL